MLWWLCEGRGSTARMVMLRDWIVKMLQVVVVPTPRSMQPFIPPPLKTRSWHAGMQSMPFPPSPATPTRHHPVHSQQIIAGAINALPLPPHLTRGTRYLDEVSLERSPVRVRAGRGRSEVGLRLLVPSARLLIPLTRLLALGAAEIFFPCGAVEVTPFSP